MLVQLTIRNFALVESLDLDIAPGMTAVTGETGAGKSIMLDALGLTLGDRADLDVIRHGQERADICATFQLDRQAPARGWLEEHDLPVEDDLCLLRRVLTRDGRSRAYINGQTTTLNELRTLGEMLIDIHSQHEHQSLLKTATHQHMLDAFGGLLPQSETLAGLATELRQLNQQLERLENRNAADAAQLDLLTFQVNEFESARLEPGELPLLEQEHQQLSHADAAIEALRTLVQLCSEDDTFNLEQALQRANALIEDLPFSTTELSEAGSMLSTALIQVEEAGAVINRALDRIELNPERLMEVDERLGMLHRLARKHRVEPAYLCEHAQALQEALQELSGGDEQVAALKQQQQALNARYREAATRLSSERGKAALKLGKAVNSKLALLGMASSVFSVALNTNPDAEPTIRGHDHVEFLVSTNPGQPPKPLVKIASGGELSRISLAIQVVTAQTTAIPVLVFDEVDVGIGGSTARAVGELLHELGKKGQVLSVTHQAQVAAQADHHLLVSKTSDKHSTHTSLLNLSAEERVTEIARMLGGDELSANSLAHARELLR